MGMRKPIVITTPMPTLEEVAREYGIGKARQKAILRIMQNGAKLRAERNGSNPEYAVVEGMKKKA